MKLMTKELLKQFSKIGDQSTVKDPIVVAKYFSPISAATWWATEYNPEDRIFYGYVTGLAFDEWGTFSLDEMESIRLPLGLSIERDLGFDPKPIRQALREYGIEY